MTVTWNLSSNLRKYKRADVLVLSVGKSGRTWLRVLLNKFLSLHFKVPFGLDDLSRHDAAVPHVLFDHEMWSHYCDAGWLDRVLGSNIVPAGVLRQKKVVVVYRDPRDVVVSLHFHKTKRSRRRMDVDLPAFIRDPHYGVGNIVHVMNLWRARLADHPHCLWLRYEDMKADPQRELSRLARFMGIDSADPAQVEEAVQFSEFENMKKMEANDAFGSSILRARDVSDPNSFKVREGKVGGYARHFGPEELAYLDRELRALDAFFGYRPESAAN